jgi:hypothetical protein
LKVILWKTPCFFMIFLTKHMNNHGSKLAYIYFWMNAHNKVVNFQAIFFSCILPISSLKSRCMIVVKMLLMTCSIRQQQPLIWILIGKVKMWPFISMIYDFLEFAFNPFVWACMICACIQYYQLMSFFCVG